MKNKIITDEIYAEKWVEESNLNHAQGIYSIFNKLTPEGEVIEFGCGNGMSSIELLKSRRVLSLENNEYLIQEAIKNIEENGLTPNIHKCDFLNLTDLDLIKCKQFMPKGILGWLIGSSGENQLKNVGKNISQPNLIAKAYREKVEDAIVRLGKSIESVNFIMFIVRGNAVEGYNEQEAYEATKNDYDTYVFVESGFKVADVIFREWDKSKSGFDYEVHGRNTHMPSTPIYTIIIAKKQLNLIAN